MDYTEISFWLKNTIPGILILGAIGSILGPLLLWVFYKFLRWFGRMINFFILTFFGKPIAAFGVIYMQQYFIIRAVIYQSINKKKYNSLLLLHQKICANKVVNGIGFIVLFMSTYFIFLFTGTEYLKTAIFSVSFTFIFLHDYILYSVFQNKIEHYFLGFERNISESTYENKDTVKEETFYSIASYLNSLSENKS